MNNLFAGPVTASAVGAGLAGTGGVLVPIAWRLEQFRAWLQPSERRDHVASLKIQVESLTRSLQAIGELLSITEAISESDLKLAMQTYVSALVQTTLLGRELDRGARRSSRIPELLTELEDLRRNISDLRQIIVIVYWDGIDPAPRSEHTVLNQELLICGPYQLIASQDRMMMNSTVETQRVPSREASVNTLEDYRSTSTLYMAGSNILNGPGNAQHMYVKIRMLAANGSSHELNCLLDTGASVDCIRKDLARSLEPSKGGLIRRLSPPLRFVVANGDTHETNLVYKGVWNLANRDTMYTHHFYMVPGLPTDVVISRQTIFQYGFLMQNPDLLALGSTSETNNIADLNILGLKPISQEQQKRQDEKKLKKALKNKEEREEQRKRIRARLEQVIVSTSKAPNP